MFICICLVGLHLLPRNSCLPHHFRATHDPRLLRSCPPKLPSSFTRIITAQLQLSLLDDHHHLSSTLSSFPDTTIALLAVTVLAAFTIFFIISHKLTIKLTWDFQLIISSAHLSLWSWLWEASLSSPLFPLVWAAVANLFPLFCLVFTELLCTFLEWVGRPTWAS